MNNLCRYIFGRLPVADKTNYVSAPHSFMRMLLLNLSNDDKFIASLKNFRIQPKLNSFNTARENCRSLNPAERADAVVLELNYNSETSSIMKYIATKMSVKINEIEVNNQIPRIPPSS